MGLNSPSPLIDILWLNLKKVLLDLIVEWSLGGRDQFWLSIESLSVIHDYSQKNSYVFIVNQLLNLGDIIICLNIALGICQLKARCTFLVIMIFLSTASLCSNTVILEYFKNILMETENTKCV